MSAVVDEELTAAARRRLLQMHLSFDVGNLMTCGYKPSRACR